MQYDFDQEINRYDTGCIKWEFYWQDEQLLPLEKPNENGDEKRLLPLWVADMDFPSPKPVVDALVERAAHGVFGYTGRTDGYCQAVVDWMQKRYGWNVQKDWVLITPGVVASLNFLVQTYVEPGQKVIIQPPVYHPFSFAVENNGAVLARNPLLLQAGEYKMDFEGLEQLARDPQTRMLILCSPHNPVGRVWSREELQRLGQICLENDVLVVSDEIHSDLIYDDVEFTAFGALDAGLSENLVVCTAASKTFNLPGLKTSNVIISNPELRQAYEATLWRAGIYGVNIFGALATQTAYNQGEDWLAQMMAYVQENYRALTAFFEERLPQIRIVKPEGTYLVWVDFRETGVDHENLASLFFEDARVHLDAGAMFGEEGAGFMRFNIACPRHILIEALERIEQVLQPLLLEA